MGPVSYGSVEYERIVIGDEEGKMRFVVKYVRTHQDLFLVHDIGRVADQDIIVSGQ